MLNRGGGRETNSIHPFEISSKNLFIYFLLKIKALTTYKDPSASLKKLTTDWQFLILLLFDIIRLENRSLSMILVNNISEKHSKTNIIFPFSLAVKYSGKL